MLKARYAQLTRKPATLAEDFRILQKSAATSHGSNRAVGALSGIFIEGTECEIISILL